MKRRYLLASACLMLTNAGAWCQAINTYRYDSLGRLIVSSVSAAPNGSKSTTIGYDPAGNRTSYTVADGSTPTPTPTPSPSAPVALNPTLNFKSSGRYTIALPTLASSSAPALIVSFAVPSGGGSASIASGAQSVSYAAPFLPIPQMCEPAETYAFSVPYTVQNAAGGQIANGTATILVTGPAGPKPPRWQMCP
ncbi:RHS repeat domain-containing protein [Sphingomonas sp.]|uniref:RHS repeat domain-containing protein n=1 Tax=Sphingomonas sp. TaxID=28214 RepID=UPI00338F32D0